MSTITQTLTLAQLREDLERLASAHPGSYPTNVIEVIHQCGEIMVDAENEEDQLREELKNVEEALEESGKEFKEATARADKAEEEAQALRAEMEQLHDGEETVSTYRERAKAAEAQTDVAYQQMREMRNAMVDAERDPDPPFQAVAPFPCEPAEPLPHDPHDLASAMLSAVVGGGAIHIGVRACAACGAEIPATEPPDTNLCGRCSQ